MEHRYVIHYTLDEQEESLEVISESGNLTDEDAKKRVLDKIKPYGKTNIENIKVVKEDVSDNINTDPETSASE